VSTIRLLIADDHPIVLRGLTELFSLEKDLEVVESCVDGQEALNGIRSLRPDVAIIDIVMPVMSGLELLQAVKAENLPTPVVLLTAMMNDRNADEAIRLGAAGVVLKEMPPHLLIQAVRKVHAGGRWIEKESLQRVTSRMLQREDGIQQAGSVLTRRELEIARMIAAGARPRQIAEQLFISEGTVKVHLHNIYEKVGARGRVELTLWVQNKGLL
jgi:DNA-binding NarL/FixJ family response regulator